jgi:hypothetical protein
MKYFEYSALHVISTRHFENTRNIHNNQIRHPLLSNKNWQNSRIANFENQGESINFRKIS